MSRLIGLALCFAILQLACGCDVKKTTETNGLSRPPDGSSAGLNQRSASVGGIVVDLDGNPVANVTISPWERNAYSSVPYGPSGPPSPTGSDGRFLLTELPNVPLKLMAQIRPPTESRELRVHFPATVFADPGQMDIRIKLDPKLQRPLP